MMLVFDLQKKITRLVDFQATTIPIVGVHEMLRLRGLDFGYPRPPLKLFTEIQRTKIKEGLIELGLLLRMWCNEHRAKKGRKESLASTFDFKGSMKTASYQNLFN